MDSATLRTAVIAGAASLRRRATVIAGSLGGVRAELLVAFGLLAGWILLTLAIARLVRPDVVWPLSGGLLALSLVGWRMLLSLFGHGLYALTRTERERRG